MNAVDRLAAIDDIKQLKARYFRALSSKDWLLFETTVAPDACFDLGEYLPGDVVMGIDGIVRKVAASLAAGTSIHHGHSPEIEIASGVVANGVWATEDLFREYEGVGSSIKSMRAYGYCFETYRRINGFWRIQTLQLKRLRVDIEPWLSMDEGVGQEGMAG